MSIKDPYPWVLEGPGLEDRLRRLFQKASQVLSGTPNQRPKQPPVGTQYYDTSLKKPIWWDGAHWKDATGNMV